MEVLLMGRILDVTFCGLLDGLRIRRVVFGLLFFFFFNRGFGERGERSLEDERGKERRKMVY